MRPRVVSLRPEERILTARSMDWLGEPQTNVWIFPREITRCGYQATDAVEWTVEYGSAICSAYDICGTDGMNQAGLVANALWLAKSGYPTQDDHPALALSAWAHYF